MSWVRPSSVIDGYRIQVVSVEGEYDDTSGTKHAGFVQQNEPNIPASSRWCGQRFYSWCVHNQDLNHWPDPWCGLLCVHQLLLWIRGEYSNLWTSDQWVSCFNSCYFPSIALWMVVLFLKEKKNNVQSPPVNQICKSFFFFLWFFFLLFCYSSLIEKRKRKRKNMTIAPCCVFSHVRKRKSAEITSTGWLSSCSLFRANRPLVFVSVRFWAVQNSIPPPFHWPSGLFSTEWEARGAAAVTMRALNSHTVSCVPVQSGNATGRDRKPQIDAISKYVHSALVSHLRRPSSTCVLLEYFCLI